MPGQLRIQTPLERGLQHPAQQAVLANHPDPDISSASIKLVRAVMADLGLAGRQPRAYKTTTIADPAATPPADHMRRDFTADRPCSKARRRYQMPTSAFQILCRSSDYADVFRGGLVVGPVEG